MKGSRSWLGIVLCALYLAAAGFVVWDTFRHTGGGWINLRWMGVTLLTAPSHALVGMLSEPLLLPSVNYSEPGWKGYGLVGLHVGVSTALVYLIGYGIEWAVKRLTLRLR